MELVTDPAQVAELAKEREDANWAFRSFLKNADLEVEELDAIVHRHCEEVTARIDCRECANCCREVAPVLEPDDVERLAKGLSLTDEGCLDRLLAIDEEDDTVFASLPCPLLKDNQCSVYEHRPDDCRSYPHLEKDGFVFHLIGVVQNCAVCPIVFNVFERLKGELWGRP